MSIEPPKPVIKPSGFPHVRRYFFTGLVIIAPAAITLWATLWVVDAFDNVVKPWIPETYNPDTYLPVKVPGFGLICALALITLVGFLAANANAQGVPQTIEIAKVDVQKLTAGYRASKVIGSSVINEMNETIGKIDDLLVTRDGKEPYAVLSIGGFLGMGTHMVVVRYDSLKFDDNKVTLPGGTKDGLKMLPAFEYAK